MRLAHWMMVAIFAAFPLAAAAEENPKPPDPANPDAYVPASNYTSAFSDYRGLSEFPESPAGIWRAVNAEMGLLGGHVGHTITPSAAEKSMPAPTAPARAKPRTRGASKSNPKATRTPGRHGMHRRNEGE